MTLLPQHQALVTASAITDAVRDARGYRSVTSADELKLLGFAPYQAKLVPGLLVPIRDAAGSVVSHQLRPDSPRKKGGQGKTVKYETVADSSMVIDVPPGARAAIGDPLIPLWVTEGARKADSAVSAGVCCVALLGVWNWRGKNAQGGSTALGHWESIALRGRTVYVAFDSDVTEKPDVRYALERFTGFLKAKGALPRIVYLPAEPGQKVGLDDYLAAGGDLVDLAQESLTELRRSTLGDDLTGRPTIRVTTELHDVVDQAEAALAELPADVDLFWRYGQLVRVADHEGVPIPEPLPREAVHELLTRAAAWVAPGPRGDEKRVSPPRDVVTTLFARGRWPRLRELAEIWTAPGLGPDGDLIHEPGYHAEARVLLRPTAKFPPVPEAPSLEDARAALASIEYMFVSFPFVDTCDRSAAVALLLTLVGRGAIQGATPLFCVRATAAGTGKGKLSNAISMVAFGKEVTSLECVGADEEWRKQITTAVLAGERFVMFDEADTLSSRALASVLTSERWTDRALGSNEKISGRRPVFSSAGNNTVIRGDLGRRLIPIDLDARMERPEQRAGFPHKPTLEAWALKHRPRLLVAALTLLRAYVVAGRPSQSLPEFGSYEAWSDFIRSALVWAGGADPWLGNTRVREESDAGREELVALLQAMRRYFTGEPVTVAQILAASEHEDDLRAALSALDKKRGEVTAVAVGNGLKRFKGSIAGGFRLEAIHLAHENVKAWRVDPAPVHDANDALAKRGTFAPQSDCPEATSLLACGAAGQTPSLRRNEKHETHGGGADHVRARVEFEICPAAPQSNENVVSGQNEAGPQGGLLAGASFASFDTSPIASSDKAENEEDVL